MPSKLLMGNEAFAWAALEAGVRVVAGYPGTPSSELIETVARLHAQGIARGVHVEWSTNEKAALEVLAGASASGARALFTCKQVGLNVASDALMSLNYVGVRGGLVLYVADDPGPISSQTEQDTRRFADFAKVPVLDPATPDQGYEMMHHAFDLSEKYATPVIVRPTTRICHASTFFEMPSSTTARPIPEGGFERDSKWVIFPRRSYQAHGEINRRLPDIAAQESRGVFNPSTECGTNSQRGIVAGGVSVQYVKEALSRWEQRLAAVGKVMPAYKFMQVGTPFPFPEEAALRFIDGLSELLVFEELDSVIEDGLLALVGAHHLSVDIKGRRTGDTLDRGENTVEDAETRLGVFLGLTDLIEGESAASFSSSSSASSLSASSPSAILVHRLPSHLHRPRIHHQPLHWLKRYIHLCARQFFVQAARIAEPFLRLSAPYGGASTYSAATLAAIHLAMPNHLKRLIPAYAWVLASRWLRVWLLSNLIARAWPLSAIQHFLRAGLRALPMLFTTSMTSRYAYSTIRRRL